MQKFLYWILPFAVLAACTPTLKMEEKEPDAQVTVADEVPALIPGEVILQVSEELASQLAGGSLQTKSASLNAVFDGLGVTRIERLYPDAGEWEPRHRKAGLHRWFRVSYDPKAQPATKAAMDFSAVEGVVFAEPQRRMRSASFFNDPYASRQWALYNDGTLGKNYEAGCDINVEPVWASYTGGSSDVIVAVIDQGVQLNHPDLAAITIPGGPNGSKSFVNQFPGYDIYPDDHGTHVAGAIAAVNNNKTGVCGVAGGLDGKGGVRILACPFMHENPDDPDHSFQGNAYEAMVWAADHGAVICNNSWGHVYDTESQAMADNVGSMGPAIDYFIQYAGCDQDGNQRADSPMKGGVVFFSAGNEGWRAAWPAAYEKVIAVGAVSAKYTKAYYSNYGDWVDICAPGGDYNLGTMIYSTIAGGKYGDMQGTSMACPLVTGVAALIVSHFGGQGFTNEMLKERLFGGASAEKAPRYGQIGPMVDALGAFTYGGTEAPEPVKSVSSSVSSNNITLSWKVTSDPDNGKSFGYLALATKDASDFSDLDPRNLPSSVRSVSVEVGALAVGETISATLKDLEFDTQYYTAVVAYDYARNYSALSPVRTVKTAGNHAPVVKTNYTGDYRVKSFETLSVDYTVSDPDGHRFRIEVTPGSDALAYECMNASCSIRIVGNAAPAGKYTAHIVATDNYGASTDYAVPYEILPNHAPVATAQIADMQFGAAGENVTLNLPDYITDEDGEPLKYSASVSEANVAHPFISENKLTITTLGYGLTTVTVTATDACGKNCSLSFRVLVRDESRPVDLYPNPVVKILNIRPGEEGQIEVAITNKAGATVWSGTENASPFAPLAIDMSGMAGGTYYVSIKGAGIDDVYTIAKR